MRKKIDVRDLQMGLYIAELDRPWIETPFLFQGFELRTSEEMEQLRKHCKYVYIDTDLGPDIAIKARNTETLARMHILAEEDKKLTRKVWEIAEESVPRHRRAPYQDMTTFEEEIIRAKEIEHQTRNAIRNMLHDAEKGSLDLNLAITAVSTMAGSTIRNPDALVCLSQLKNVSEYAALHSLRSCILALAFGRHMVYTKDEINILGLGALMHDIGMAMVPKEILDKPGPLTEEEAEIIKKHVGWGTEMVFKSGGIDKMAMQFIEQHHERYDGSGYPYGLEGDSISTAGTIGAIIDVYDAITSDRGYAKGLSAEDALKKIYEWSNQDFKKELVEEFIRCMGIFPIGSLVELSTGSIGVVVTINRYRRLKPRIALVLNPDKQPYKRKIIITLLDFGSGKDEVKIKRVLPANAYGIDPMAHIVQL